MAISVLVEVRMSLKRASDGEIKESAPPVECAPVSRSD
jgi:hypothetical protein